MQASTQAIVQLEVVIRNKTGGEIVKHVDQVFHSFIFPFFIYSFVRSFIRVY